MSLKILVMDSYYQPAVDQISAVFETEGLDSYDEMELVTNDFNSSFANIFAHYFTQLGWDSKAVIVNVPRLQRAWAHDYLQKNVLRFGWKHGNSIAKRKFLSFFLPYIHSQHWVLIQQTKFYKPDVVLINDLYLFPSTVLTRIRQNCNLLVGHISSNLRSEIPISSYDVLLSSVPNNLERAKEKGVNVLRLLPGFDVREHPGHDNYRDIDCSFVGQLYGNTIDILVTAKKVFPDLQIFSPAKSQELIDAGLGENWSGRAFGRKMYEVLGKSKITLNRHGDIAKDFAANMRLFEATGMGAALVTDWKPDLVTLFRENEVASYQTLEELFAVLTRLSQSPSEVRSLGAAGQKRTLNSHTYSQRVEMVSDFLKAELAKKVPK